MNYWLISDTHFHHTRLEQWGMRAGDWQERLWAGLSRVPAEDALIHLGDVSIGHDDEVHTRIIALPAKRKVLVLGNHCKRSKSWYFDKGWSFVCDGFEMNLLGERILFSHRPQQPDERFTLNIHGHTHGNSHRGDEHDAFYRPSYHVDICPEFVGYNPLRLDTLLKMQQHRHQV